MDDETGRIEHPFYSLALQSLVGGTLTVELLRRGNVDALISGLSIAAFDYPLQWANERAGSLWRIKTADTARRVRDGFPYEEPTLFFLGGALICRMTDTFRSSFFRRWVPSLIGGIVGGLMDNTLNAIGKLDLVHPRAPVGVALAYGLGTFGVLKLRDLPRRTQVLVLLGILFLAYLTYPGPPTDRPSSGEARS